MLLSAFLGINAELVKRKKESRWAEGRSGRYKTKNRLMKAVLCEGIWLPEQGSNLRPAD
jgi:hypothetical protein